MQHLDLTLLDETALTANDLAATNNPPRAGGSGQRAAPPLQALVPPRLPSADARGLTALQPVLDALGCGLLLVDVHGRVLHANRAARLLCHAAAPMAMVDGQLALASADAERLTQALQRAQRGHWAMLTLRPAHAEARPSGQAAPMSLGVVPLDDAGFDVGPSAAPLRAGGRPGVALRPADAVGAVAWLVVGAQRQTSSLALQFFSQEHHLTLAERLVLQSLCDGRTPKQIAQQAGVAICTVRTQILSIREKARAPSIRHLLQMVESLPPLMGVALGGA